MATGAPSAEGRRQADRLLEQAWPQIERSTGTRDLIAAAWDAGFEYGHQEAEQDAEQMDGVVLEAEDQRFFAVSYVSRDREQRWEVIDLARTEVLASELDFGTAKGLEAALNEAAEAYDLAENAASPL